MGFAVNYLDQSGRANRNGANKKKEIRSMKEKMEQLVQVARNIEQEVSTAVAR